MKSKAFISLLFVVIVAGLFGEAFVSSRFPTKTVQVVVAGTPTFVRESLRLNVDGGFASSVAFPLTGATAISAGHRAVFMLAVAQTLTVSSITDNAGGNTWTVDLTGNSVGQSGIAICSSNLATTLTASNTITVNFSGTAAFQIAASLIDLSGCATSGQPDSSAGVNHVFATTVSLSGNTVATNTVAVGVLTDDSNGTYTYNTSNWNIIGAGETFSNSAGRICAFVYKSYSAQTTGANPGGTWTTGNVDQVNGWVAYK